MRFLRSLSIFAALMTAMVTVAPAAPERPSAPGDPMPVRVLDPESGIVTFTTPNIDLQPWPNLVRVTASFSYPEAVPQRPEKITMIVTRSGSQQRWKPSDQLSLRSASQRMFWNCEFTAKEVQGVMVETARAEIETPFFIALMRDDEISLEIGKTTGMLDRGWLRPLKELVRRIPVG